MRYVTLVLLMFLAGCASTQAVLEHPATQVGITVGDVLTTIFLVLP